MSITAQRKPGRRRSRLDGTDISRWLEEALLRAYSRVSPIERYTAEEEFEEDEGRTEYAEFKMLGKVRQCQRKRQK